MKIVNKTDTKFFVLLQVLVLVAVSTARGPGDTITLNDGNQMPILSLGTVGIVSIADAVLTPAVAYAIESGYRQLDTAAIYRNEVQVGNGIAEAINRGVVSREDLWITTKLHPNVTTREGVVPAIRESLERLQVDYIDLYLIHVPFNLFDAPDHDIVNIWKGMEDAKALNLTRSIGVSNFDINQINRILNETDTVPAVNEIKVNPTFSNVDIVSYCQKRSITILAYAPFGFMVQRPFVLYDPPLSTFEEPILRQLARKYGKIPSQIFLRSLVDRGIVPIPRSTNFRHIVSNMNIFDFQLTSEEVDAIIQLNVDDKVYIFDPEPLEAMMNYYGIY